MRYRFPPGGGVKTTVSHFLYLRTRKAPPMGLKNSQESRSPGKYAAPTIRSPAGFDPVHSTVTGPPTLPLTAGKALAAAYHRGDRRLRLFHRPAAPLGRLRRLARDPVADHPEAGLPGGPDRPP